MSILYTPFLKCACVAVSCLFLRNMVFDIWFALVVIVFLEVVIGSIVFGQAVSSFFLPLVVLVWFTFFFRFCFEQKNIRYIQKPSSKGI